jgi:hypothetical protein
MNHKGILHLSSKPNGPENRSIESRKNATRDRKALARRTSLPMRRAEVAWLDSRRKAGESGAQQTHSPDRAPWLEYLSQRFVRRGLKEKPAPEAAGETNNSAVQKKLICRFLSWCFPVRGFNSPLQRLLYLSVQGPKSKRRSRLLFR